MLLVGKVADECCLWERLRTNAACGKGCEKKTLKGPRSAHPQSPSRKRKGSSSNHHFPGAMFFNPPKKITLKRKIISQTINFRVCGHLHFGVFVFKFQAYQLSGHKPGPPSGNHSSTCVNIWCSTTIYSKPILDSYILYTVIYTLY